MRRIGIRERAGAFAENKDVAREIRLNEILPALQKQEEVVLDFAGVDAVTQSFVHALISDALRQHGGPALEKIIFKSCNESVKKMIGIVVDYMQDGGEA